MLLLPNCHSERSEESGAGPSNPSSPDSSSFPGRTRNDAEGEFSSFVVPVATGMGDCFIIVPYQQRNIGQACDGFLCLLPGKLPPTPLPPCSSGPTYVNLPEGHRQHGPRKPWPSYSCPTATRRAGAEYRVRILVSVVRLTCASRRSDRHVAGGPVLHLLTARLI